MPLVLKIVIGSPAGGNDRDKKPGRAGKAGPGFKIIKTRLTRSRVVADYYHKRGSNEKIRATGLTQSTQSSRPTRESGD